MFYVDTEGGVIMPYNEKSRANLIQFKKGDKRTKEAVKKGNTSPKRKEKQKMRGVVKAFLDAPLPKEEQKKLAQQFGFEDDVLTNRMVIILTLMGIIKDKDSPAVARIQGIDKLIQYAGEDALAEQLNAAQAAQMFNNEDDPFSKSIKERINK